MKNCFCGNSATFNECCKPLLDHSHQATSAEQLMRSRYSAYCISNSTYLLATTHQSVRNQHSENDILAWAKANKWSKLEIISTSENLVEFKAYYVDQFKNTQIHHEKSTFIFENRNWFYVDGVFY